MQAKIGRIVNEIEESLIAIILGLMTVITFANVVARYVLNTNILWALEATVFTDPETIGPYRIVGKVGEGGMGVVYLAEQDKPIRRQVAVKLVKLGMDTAEVIARFDSERQALARAFLANGPAAAFTPPLRPVSAAPPAYVSMSPLRSTRRTTLLPSSAM